MEFRDTSREKPPPPPPIQVVQSTGTNTNAVAHCPAGFVVTGGGFQVPVGSFIFASYPSRQGGGAFDSWSVHGGANEGQNLVAWAVCMQAM